ncbi:Tll0287-like domain-containing protein [Rhodoblastus sp.]|uniref:Tll0287-like domain-containing protein n=1 Tax=Rhodoblastus sp. TaxID=1962975 RepID=UPI003F94A94F
MIKGVVAGLGLFLLCGSAFADEAALKAQAAQLTGAYAKELQATMAGALAKGGPLGALDICNKQAPKIASDLSKSSGWSIGRTSLKPRNAASTPDDYERKVMENFDARLARGEKPDTLVSAAVVEGKDGKLFRFMKAIPTGAICLTCHGANVAPELKQKISQLYPSDQATGFKLGDLRGAFTLKKVLDGAGD